MNTKLPITLFIGLVFWVGFFVAFPYQVSAVSIAEQTQNYDSGLNVWQVIQELGSTLSGTAQSFTFRVSTSRSNLNQFDFTALNTKIYDKDAGNAVVAHGCISSASDPLSGLTFTTTNVPAGYENVTIDFTCNNYTFIQGHRYLIFISNANTGNSGSGLILFAATNYDATSDYFTGGGVRYGNGNRYDYANNGGRCNSVNYIWNSQSNNSGCIIFNSSKDDLYFSLTNTAPPPPPPRLPVIFIPGIGGSEFKASQDIVWSADNGHGGTYSHAYGSNEKIWVNQDKAAELGDDDYFDVLRLKTDGETPEAALSLTGDLTSFGYPDIDSFFTGMGYVKGTNYFVFPYDWRKDVRNTKDLLDSLIETAKAASGQSKVNLVVHSMGGLVGRFYISDPNKASKVNKLIELGVPHLGAPSALETLMYGSQVGPSYLFGLISLNINETRDVVQNFSSNAQLNPSKNYFNFYDNSKQDLLYPFRDDRDIDNDGVTGSLKFDQIKNLLSNLNYNMTVLSLGEQFHNLLDPILNQTNGTKVYEIVGSSQPTLGQIHETWWITWPIDLFSKRDEIYINGDGTVPLYSASLKNDSLDISGTTKIYYVEQTHSNLVSSNGTAMQTVKAILDADNLLPVEVKDQKITLEGEQISLDDGELDLYDENNNHCGENDKGEIEENIPDVTCTSSGNTKHAFVKKKAKKVKVTVTRKKPAVKSKTTTVKKRTYKEDKISKTVVYKDITIPQTGKVEFTLDPAVDTAPTLTFYPDTSKPEETTVINPTSEVSGDTALDQTAPKTTIQISGDKNSSGIYTGPVTVTLTGNDTESGILRIEYSLDDGKTVQVYTEPFIISTPGKTTIQIKSIDKLGNEEIPQSITIEIAIPPTPTPTPSPISTTTNTSEVGSDFSEVNSVTTTSSPVIARSEATRQSSTSISNKPDILGLTFENPSHISDQINVSNILGEQINPTPNKITINPATEILGGLLVVSGGMVTLASLGLIITFLKPIPSKMK